jgi:hypothetical protein
MAAKNLASDYDGRIRRAERLAALHPFTQEILKVGKEAFDSQFLAQRREIFINCSRLAVRNHSRVQTLLKFSYSLVESQDFLRERVEGN